MKYGFTLLELLLSIGIVSLLFALGSVSYFSSYKSTNLDATSSVLLSDLRAQQARAMSGEGRGIKIASDRYTLFTPPFDPNNSSNIINLASDGITFSSSFSGGDIIFVRGTGELSGFVAGQDTITLTSLGTTKVIRLNPYGIVIGD